MSVRLCLLSGQSCELPRASARELKEAAKKELGIGISALIWEGRALADEEVPEAEATLFALAKRALLCGKPGYGAGFVCVRGDGTAVCWGHVPPAPPLGGVRQLVASARAFAAVMEDGSVASWGQREFGADSLELRPLLCGVVSLAASLGAFAALREDGQVVSWGNPLYGGHRGVPLGGVVAVTASAEAFAATTKEGRVVCWGHPESGGCAKRVQERLVDVRKVVASYGAFCALTSRGVVGWGDESFGAEVEGSWEDVVDLAASQSAFAALHSDGSVTCWGRGDAGGRGSAQGVARLRASARAFAAIRVDGTVTCWGHRDFGGDCGAVQAQLTGVAEVAATHSAFAALKSNGEVVTWGRPEHGGDRCGLRDVQHIEASFGAFAALLGDGSVVTWGDADSGGDSSAVREQLRRVQ